MAYPPDPVQADVPAPAPVGTTQTSRAKAFLAWITSPKVESRITHTVVWGLALYTIIHRTGV